MAYIWMLNNFTDFHLTMKDIKTVISLLCNHFNQLFSINLKPEVLRLAKYNKADKKGIETLWILLSQLIGEDSYNGIKSIQHHFYKDLNYRSVEFYKLSEDKLKGSRELLLALAFILAQNYLNKHIANVIENSLLNPKISTNTDKPYEAKKYTFDLKQFKNDNDYTNAIEWMEGVTSNNYKEIEECENHLKFLLEKANISNVAQYKDLPLHQLVALGNERYQKEFLLKAKELITILRTHEEWLQSQSTFWDWMNSILNEKSKSQKLNKVAIKKRSTSLNK